MGRRRGIDEMVIIVAASRSILVHSPHSRIYYSWMVILFLTPHKASLTAPVNTERVLSWSVVTVRNPNCVFFCFPAVVLHLGPWTFRIHLLGSCWQTDKFALTPNTPIGKPFYALLLWKRATGKCLAWRFHQHRPDETGLKTGENITKKL